MPKPTKPTLSPYTDQLPDVNNPATWADRTPLFWNWVTGPGYVNMTDALTYSDDVADYLDTALAGDTQTLIDSLNTHYAGHDTYRATVGGTADALTLTTAYSLTTVPQNTLFYFFPTSANTGAATINVDGIGAVNAKTITGEVMPAGYLRANVLTQGYYDGTDFIVDRENEIGSGPNGNWVRKANGRQECYFTGDALNASITSSASGPLYYSDGGASTWTYPVQFTEKASAFGSLEGDALRWISVQSTSVSGAKYIHFKGSSSSNTVASRLSAFGPWY